MIYEEIYEKFYHTIVNYSFRWLKNEYYAQEIANETFAFLWLEWKSKSFPNENALLAWLYNVADYKIMEHRRKKYNKYIPLDSDFVHNMADAKAAVDNEEIDNYQEEQRFLEYMSVVRNRLEGEDSKLFDMKIISKFPYVKIAAELNTTVPAIKMRWHRLKRQLRQIARDITGEEL